MTNEEILARFTRDARDAYHRAQALAAGHIQDAATQLKLFSCRIEWVDMGPSYFSVLDTSKVGANSTILTRITHLGRSTSNINEIEIEEVVGPFEKGFIIMEAL